MPHTLLHESTTEAIIGSFFEVYNNLGYGFLENLYRAALARELTARGHGVEREVLVRIVYKGEDLGVQRLDMIVDGNVVIEVKSTQYLHPSATRQVESYLRGTKLEVGMLLYFGPTPRFIRLIRTNPPHP